jgi:hypothetical protein
MLLRRYGANVQSVEPNFEARALNEIAFRRDQQHSFAAADFDAEWQRVGDVTESGEAQGSSHNDVEQGLLDDLAARIKAHVAALEPGEALLIENDPGIDWPKSRQLQKNVIVDGENRLHFIVSIDPSVRLGRYRRGGA